MYMQAVWATPDSCSPQMPACTATRSWLRVARVGALGFSIASSELRKLEHPATIVSAAANAAFCMLFMCGLRLSG
jgi:hypothetical protein